MSENEDNTASMGITLGRGDSVILAGKDITEVKYKENYSMNQVRVVVIADKSVKIIRRKAEDRFGKNEKQTNS